MNLSRRLFLGFATAMAVMPVSGREIIPTLVGDGEHDDAPAINALLAGEPMRFDPRLSGGERIVSGRRHLAIRNAKVSIRQAVIIPPGARLDMRAATLFALPGFVPTKGESGVFGLRVQDGATWNANGVTLDFRNMWDGDGAGRARHVYT